MDSLERLLERMFARLDEFETRLSGEWREHSNRRTVAILLLAGALLAFFYLYVVEPPADFPTGQLVSISEGSSLDSIAQVLEEDGVIRSAFTFKAIVTVMGRQRNLYAGDYQFKEPEDIFSIARAISIGAYGLVPIRIRIPEGATMAQMAQVYASQLPRFNAANFLAQTQADEGYLFPDTYFFLPNATETTVIQAMRQDFDTQIASIEPAIASSTHSLSDIVTMASIVEKEAPDTEDRLMIAGILWRRLSLGLPLQADPTLVYETGKSDSQLTIADLESDSPYNTYTRTGLPPTPIGSPSLDSIEAAAQATSSPYLYYLADKNGVTHYAKTYAQQLANERKYLGT